MTSCVYRAYFRQLSLLIHVVRLICYDIHGSIYSGPVLSVTSLVHGQLISKVDLEAWTFRRYKETNSNELTFQRYYSEPNRLTVLLQRKNMKKKKNAARKQE